MNTEGDEHCLDLRKLPSSILTDLHIFLSTWNQWTAKRTFV